MDGSCPHWDSRKSRGRGSWRISLGRRRRISDDRRVSADLPSSAPLLLPLCCFGSFIYCACLHQLFICACAKRPEKRRRTLRCRLLVPSCTLGPPRSFLCMSGGGIARCGNRSCICLSPPFLVSPSPSSRSLPLFQNGVCVCVFVRACECVCLCVPVSVCVCALVGGAAAPLTDANN